MAEVAAFADEAVDVGCVNLFVGFADGAVVEIVCDEEEKVWTS